MTELALRARLVAHLSMSHGATYGERIVDEAGRTLGHRSTFVSKNERKHPSRTIYTLGDREFVNDLEGFRAALAAELEQQRRDGEWEAAAPAANANG